MIKKTKYQQLPALLQKGVAALALASCFVGCAVSDPLNTDEATGELTFSASIGDPKEIIVSRASGDEAWEKLTGTYLSFKEGIAFGVYGDKGFDPDGMKNLAVMKRGSAWTTVSPVMWQGTSITDGITFNAYYPQSKTPEAYSILATSETGDEYQLKDVLVATRTNVSYNNPALFFTFTHRFALLRIKLGNGFDGFVGKVTATMAQAVATTVNIATNGGLVKLTNTEGTASTFVSPTTTGREFYVLVPADVASDAWKVTSITLGDKTIKNTSENPNNMPELSTEPNTIYTLTAHVIDGAPVIRVVGIEAWTEAEYLGNGKGKPGIYTEEELAEFAAAYNSEDGDRDYKLSSFGEKKAGVWTIYLQDNLYLPELEDLRTEENESEYTATLVTNFSDIFAGQGYTINGMSIVGGNGLFGTLTSTARVNDLILTDASVTNTLKDKTLANSANSAPTGILAGTAMKGSVITNCHIFGTSASTGTSDTGGLVGSAAGEINRSSSFAVVSGPTSGDFFIGGLVGQAATTTIIKNSFAKGWVTGTAGKVGALVGNGVSSIAVTNCYATVNVNGALQSLEYTKTK